MKDPFEYKKTGKVPSKEFGELKDWLRYLDSLKRDGCPIDCDYARALSEDVKSGEAFVYEKGDIICSYAPGVASCFVGIPVTDFCMLKEFKIIDGVLEAICFKSKEEKIIKIS